MVFADSTSSLELTTSPRFLSPVSAALPASSSASNAVRSLSSKPCFVPLCMIISFGSCDYSHRLVYPTSTMLPFLDRKRRPTPFSAMPCKSPCMGPKSLIERNRIIISEQGRKRTNERSRPPDPHSPVFTPDRFYRFPSCVCCPDTWACPCVCCC